MTKKKVTLVQGGLGAEKDISFLSGKAVARAFDSLGLTYNTLNAGPSLPSLLYKQKPEVLFLATHGQYAEDGTLQALAEYLKIPYTGSGVLASALCMDKCFFKDFISLHQIPTLPYQKMEITKKSLPSASSLQVGFPLVVKPSREGSSLGVGICRHPKDLKPALEKALKHDNRILLESYREGTELAVSFLAGRLLTPVEIVPKTGFYDYKNKYTRGATEYILPSRLPGPVIKQCQSLTLKAVKALGVRGYARADFIVPPSHTPFMMEINTLPGLSEHSLLPKSAKYDGFSFPEVVRQILHQARRDYSH